MAICCGAPNKAAVSLLAGTPQRLRAGIAREVGVFPGGIIKLFHSMRLPSRRCRLPPVGTHDAMSPCESNLIKRPAETLTMYEIHDNTERFPPVVRFDYEQELPEPLDPWTLRDFADIVPIASYAS